MRELIPLRSFLLELCIIIILRLQDFNLKASFQGLKLGIIQRLASVPRSNAWPIKFQIKFVITLSKIRSILDPGCCAAFSRFKFGCLFSVKSSLRVCCVTTKKHRTNKYRTRKSRVSLQGIMLLLQAFTWLKDEHDLFL